MRLFTIGEDFTVELNKEWILLIPEFRTLVHRDKGGKDSPGDNDGRRKYKAKRELAFIYFMLDFTSPIYNYEEFERREEAMKYVGFKEKDIDKEVMAAYDKYDELLLQSSRSLKTLRSLELSLNTFDKYLATLDFTKKDKMDRLVNDPSKYLSDMKKLNEGFDMIDKFRKRVMEEMKGDQGIRGANSLGRKEGKRTNDWSEVTEQAEGEPVKTAAPVKQMNFKDIGNLLRGAEGKMINDDSGPDLPQLPEEEVV